MHLLKLTLLTAIISTTAIANSAMVFPQRAILDSQTRTANFKVVNPSNKVSLYTIDLVDRVQSDSGRTSVSADYDKSAKANLVYTPRKSIKLEKNGKKPIRVKLKKYAEMADGEYRTYLNIVTDNPNKETPDGYAVSVRTGIQLPIIIRKGKLSATADITDVKLKDNKVDVSLMREGTRSIFGNIKITQNGKTLGEAKNVSVFVESNHATYSVDTNGLVKNQPISVTFTEEKSSGAIKLEKAFTL